MVTVSENEASSDVAPIELPGQPAAPGRNDADIPYVVKADVGRLPDGSVGLRLTFAASEEAYQSKAWEEVAFLIGPATARELAASLAWQ